MSSDIRAELLRSKISFGVIVRCSIEEAEQLREFILKNGMVIAYQKSSVGKLKVVEWNEGGQR